MIRTSVFRPIISGLFLALALAQTAPALAAQQDIDMLQAYVGSWKGFGNMGTGEKEETVGCKLTVTSSRPDRVTFNGQCALAGGAVKLYGTMGYIEEKNRFEAVLNSSSSFLQDKVAIRPPFRFRHRVHDASDKSGHRCGNGHLGRHVAERRQDHRGCQDDRYVLGQFHDR